MNTTIFFKFYTFINNKVLSIICHRMLRGDPSRRPNIEEVLEDDFFHFGYMPSKLPTSCLTVQPRFHPELLQSVQRKPLSDLNHSTFRNSYC